MTAGAAELPKAIESEKAVIAAALIDSSCVAQIVAAIQPGNFYENQHRAIMKAIDALYFDGVIIDAAALVEKIKEQGNLHNGLGSYIAKLMDYPAAQNIDHHCGLIRQAAQDREALSAMNAALQAGGNSKQFKLAVEDVFKVLQRRYADVPGNGRCGFAFHHIGDFDLTAPKWLAHGIIEQDSLLEIFGDPGTGKSILAVALACCVASGRSFFGHVIVNPGPVAYICGEGRNGLARRFSAWAIRNGVNYKELPIFSSSVPAMLCDPEHVDIVQREILNIAEQHGPPALIIVDTLSRNFGPGDENSTKDMAGFISGCDRLRAPFGSAVGVVHHSGHGDKTRGRGSMALRGAMDVEYRLEKDQAGTIRFEIAKPPKDFRPPEPQAFVIRSVELGIIDADGNQVTAPIFDEVEYKPKDNIEPQRNTGRGRNQQTAIDALDRLIVEHQGRLKAANLDPATARVTLSDWSNACRVAGMDKRAFFKVKESLVNQNIVSVFRNTVTLTA